MAVAGMPLNPEAIQFPECAQHGAERGALTYTDKGFQPRLLQVAALPLSWGHEFLQPQLPCGCDRDEICPREFSWSFKNMMAAGRLAPKEVAPFPCPLRPLEGVGNGQQRTLLLPFCHNQSQKWTPLAPATTSRDGP